VNVSLLWFLWLWHSHACAFARNNGGFASAGSAFSLLRDGRVASLESYIINEASVRDTLKAVRDEHCGQLAVEKAFAAALEAEEAGEVLRHFSVVLPDGLTTDASRG
jgi:hypothetical protein